MERCAQENSNVRTPGKGMNKSQNAVTGNEIKTPSNTTVYTKGMEIFECNSPSVAGPIDYGRDADTSSSETDYEGESCESDTNDLVNQTSSLILDKKNTQATATSTSGLGTETLHKCMEIRHDREFDDAK